MGNTLSKIESKFCRQLPNCSFSCSFACLLLLFLLLLLLLLHYWPRNRIGNSFAEPVLSSSWSPLDKPRASNKHVVTPREPMQDSAATATPAATATARLCTCGRHCLIDNNFSKSYSQCGEKSAVNANLCKFEIRKSKSQNAFYTKIEKQQ